MTRVLVLAGAGISLSGGYLSQDNVYKNQYVEEEDAVMIFECPNVPKDLVEVDTTIIIGTCSEFDNFETDMVIDENGDYNTELQDALSELYNAEAEGFTDGE